MSIKVEIKGVNFINKGAEMMLLSIKEQLVVEYPDVKIGLNMRTGSIPKILNQGFYLIPHYFTKKFNFANNFFSLIIFLIPKFLLCKLKLIKKNDIDVVLDASGFTYSDQWGVDALQVMNKYYSQIKRRKGKVIFLPQAFGPFSSEKIKIYANKLLTRADLICVRDRISMNHVTEVLKSEDTLVKLYPDFTNLLEGIHSPEYDQFNKKVCIIPNYRMIDKGENKLYIDFLYNGILLLNTLEKSFYFLVHEGDKDYFIVSQLEELIGQKMDCIFEGNPQIIKSIIGKSDFLIGSRYHGLISSLSQGIPVLISGWSHKYEQLAKDYDIENLIIYDLKNKDILTQKISYIIKNRNEIKNKILAKSQLLKNKSKIMWKEVFDIMKSH